MDKPPELLKNFADRLARVASSSDGAQSIRMLRQAGVFASPDFTSPEMSEPRHAWKAPGRSSAAGQANDHVGIWERKTEGGETNFVRRKEMVKDWSFWANVGRIEPRKARKRVVLIGESVARGFLYDPQFTPAMALEKILNLHLGDGEIEVIDLARTNLSFEVQELALSALLLEPDMTILFCGNNWDPGPPSRLEMPALDTVLREQGIPGLKRLGEAKLAARVTGLVDEIASVYRERKVPLLWIVREFNLGDWRDALTNAPYLTEGLNQQWIALREAAEKAFVEGELGLTGDLASRMVGIDQGTCVTPLYLLAECGRQKGDVEATRRYLEMARDAVIWDTSKNSAPRTYSLTANTLREQTR